MITWLARWYSLVNLRHSLHISELGDAESKGCHKLTWLKRHLEAPHQRGGGKIVVVEELIDFTKHRVVKQQRVPST